MALKTYSGTCHCGAVRYEADIDLAAGSNRCNCSYCRKVRVWFAFAKGAESFRLLAGDALTEYRWTPPGRQEPSLTYSFCGTCGVRAFARGELERFGGTFHAVSIPTLELSDAELAAIPVQYVNGRDGNYDSLPEHLHATI